ncbi:MAG TPA: iron-containing alcohol dehydrogenase [Pirellulales bacterium]|jgi:alcohol dehydrogenase|nr:iron-containing alcohol dehydrogenase [Pirellulales bacterium]
MIPFDFHPRTRIVFGPGKVDALGELAGELGARRVLVVSDPGIIAAGHTEHGLAALRRAGIETHLFDGVTENPTTDDVESGLALARRYEPELLVGLGGGSSMDCAKGINFLFTNGGRMQDYLGVGKATRPMLPMIAVPTTAGTGSETQSFALISDAQSHVKMACGDKKAAFRIALLDPSLTVTQPRRVTALTGIDAIAHALETYVTRSRNPASLAFSREAWLLLGENFARVLDDPNDLPARSGMQLGACFAGLAIENSMLGAAHALANPLTTNYQIVHGQAVGLMLPHVIRFNGAEVNGWYHDLLECTAAGNGFPAAETGADGLAGFVAELAHHAELPSRLSECGVDPNRLPQLAAEAAKQWTGSFNPRKVDEAELLALYRAAY